ncbi:MAG: tetratricopeptide repeat protein, partial [Bacteroidia bacterium]
IITIPANIALQIAEHLQAFITNTESQNISNPITDNVEAYNLYLKGIFESRTATINGNTRCINYMKQAIALDSTFALAIAGLAAGHIGRAAIFSAELSALDAFAMAKPLIDKALAIDPELPEAHLRNASYLLYNNWDFSGAELEYKKAIVDDDPDALAFYVDLLNFTNRHQEALAISERLNQTNPYYTGSRMILSLYYMGKYETATEFAESRLETFNTYILLDSYGFLMLNTGNYDKAIELFQKAIELNSVRTPRMLGWMGAAYARMGNKEKSIELINELKSKREQSVAGSPAFFIAVIYSALEDKALALQWLQDSYENHEMEIPWLKSEPQLYGLHDEPVFQSLLEKVGFP